MDISLEQYLALLLASMLAVGLLTPLMRLIAVRLNVVDSPDQSHKTHRTPIPYLGGVAIILGVLGVTSFSLIGYSMSQANTILALSLLLPAVALGLIGLVDDIRNLSPWPRFVAQSVAGLLTAILLISTDTVGTPTGSMLVDALITIIWIVGVTNSINFFDNLDGGASGTVTLTSIALLILALQGGQYLIAAMAAVLAGATLGFLIWNRPPARIYMGDAGALFLGLLIASLVIRLDTNPINNFATFSIPILLLAVPIMDTTVAVLSRIKRGISPFKGGRDHLSHRLMRSGLSKRATVLTLWAMSAYFGALSIILSNAPFPLEGIISLICAVSWLMQFSWFLSRPSV
jgi:UDP-GlcNAc:undecaprenyl-phosphate GlcNAc-1-phosphate transferase